MRLWALVIGAAALCSCKTKPPPAFELAIKIQGDPGELLAGARVDFNGKKVGLTDKSGVAKLRLQGTEGQTFALMVQCPDGYDSPSKPVVVTLRRIVAAAKLPEYDVSCPRSHRNVVIAVRAENGPNLPVFYLGREVARTDASGAAHVGLKVTPGQQLQVQIKTEAPEASKLRPQNPSNSFEVKNRDEIFVFDQEFKQDKPKRYYRRPSGPKGPTPI